jgi:hypothetical protein
MRQPAESIEAGPARPRVALQLRRPRSGTLGLAVILMGLLAATGETLVRLAPVRARLLAPSFGSSLRELELQWFGLEEMVATYGPIDCLFVGSSLVQRGLDPRAFAMTYRGRTGRDLHCFNFGVAGMTASTAGLMADILVRRYHPPLLVYGASPFDLSAVTAQRASKVTEEMERSPWARYQLGTFTVAGWLIEHSQAYRHYLTHRNWMTADYWPYLGRTRHLESSPSVSGYYTSAVKSAPITERPDVHEQQAISKVLVDLKFSGKSLGGLERIARLSEQGGRVALVEIPLPGTLMTFIPEAEPGYRKFVGVLVRSARAHRLPLWQTQALNLIPDDGWSNFNHMNNKGAEIFGAWLGEQVAAFEASRAVNQRAPAQ